MIPASRVNASNYELLGNRIAGETRRSRMQRVNTVKSHVPSLTHQNQVKNFKIGGSKPLSLGSGHVNWQTHTLLVPTLAGALSFGLVTAHQGSSFASGKRKETVQGGTAIAIGSTIMATLVGQGMNKGTVGLFDNDFGTDNYVFSAGSMILPLLLATVKPDKNRSKAQRKVDLKRAAYLGAPAALLSLSTNPLATLPIYGASLLGLFAARRYSKI